MSRCVGFVLGVCCLLLLAAPAHAQSCDSTCPLEDLLTDIDSVLSISPRPGRRPLYGELSRRIEPTQMSTSIGSLSPTRRERLADELVGILRAPELSSGNRCRERQVRANAFAMLYELASLAVENDNRHASAVLGALLDEAEAETDPRLRRQNAVNLDRLMNAVGLRALSQRDRATYRDRIQSLFEEVLPTSPPYDLIFKNPSEVTVVIHGDAEAFTHSGFHTTFEGIGGTTTKHSNTHWTINFPFNGINFNIELYDHNQQGYDGLDLFRNMRHDSIPIEVYAGHSQYGTALDPSLEMASANSKQRKVFLIGACKSKVFASRVYPKYPNTHFIWTDDGEWADDTPFTLSYMLQGFAYRETWQEIRTALDDSGATLPRNYFLPDDYRVLTHTDSDDDGIPDASDRVYDCGMKKPSDLDAFTPKSPRVGHLQLRGEKALYAVKAAEGLLGYVPYTKGFENRFYGDGWAAADVNAPAAVISPARDSRGNEIYRVRINAAYSHLSDDALSVLLANELTTFVADRGLSRTRRLGALSKQILAYEMGVELLNAWDRSDLYDAYQQRFALPRPVTWWEATEKLDYGDGVTPATLAHIRRVVQ